MYDALLLNWRNKQVKPKPNRDKSKNVLISIPNLSYGGYEKQLYLC